MSWRPNTVPAFRYTDIVSPRLKLIMTSPEGSDTTGDKQGRNNTINRRRGHRAYVTKTINSVRELLQDYSETNKNRLLSYRTSLKDKSETLNALNEEVLLGLAGSTIEEEILQSSEIQDDIQEVLFEIEEKLQANMGDHCSRSPPPAASSDGHSNAKLPKLTLPIFSGDPIEYQSFWDSFNASVHNNEKLDNVVKFNYLKSVLREAALSSISGLSLTTENYVEAVDILRRRYGNKQLLISTHMDKLLSIPAVTSLQDVKKIRPI